MTNGLVPHAVSHPFNTIPGSVMGRLISDAGYVQASKELHTLADNLGVLTLHANCYLHQR